MLLATSLNKNLNCKPDKVIISLVITMMHVTLNNTLSYEPINACNVLNYEYSNVWLITAALFDLDIFGDEAI